MTEWNKEEATEYVRLNAIDNEDFLDSEDDDKIRYMNVANRTLKRKYADYDIPNEAVYLFAAVLAAAFNDTNKMAQQGVASFSVRGISFTFKDWARRGLDSLITEEITDIIGAPTGRRAKWTVI